MTLEPLGEAHLEALLPFVREYHGFEGVQMPDPARRRAVAGLLADPGLGRVWAVSAQSGWIGYLALTYGYSIEMQGRDAFIDELFIRKTHRNRGFGTRALKQVRAEAGELGIRALHLEVDRGNHPARAFYAGLGFELRGRFSLMTWYL